MMLRLKPWRLLATSSFLLFCCAATPAQQEYGEVAFANSGLPAAQHEFLTGLALLHNFEYPDAAEHFRKAQQLAPDFAMAYWGEAMTRNHPVWHQQDLSAAREVLTRLGPTPEARLAKAPTEREKLYLHSIEILYGDGAKEERDQKYESAMADLHRKFPDDVDAASFYALAILGSVQNGRDFATYMRAAAVLEDVFPQHPRHPGVVHYLIHSYDDPVHAPLGLRAAHIYSKIAPDAGHAQHMTSHIFLSLGMWDDTIAANETAVAVVNRQRKQAGKPPRMCGHYNEWLEYGYLQRGRVADARRILEGCRQEAVQAAASAAAGKAEAPDLDSILLDSYSSMHASFVIDTQLWNDEVVRATLPPGDYPSAQFTFDYVNALAAIRRGDTSVPDAVRRVESDRQRLEAWLDQRKLPEPQDRKRALILTGQLQALLSLRSGKSDDAIRELQRLAASEQEMPLEFGPPVIDKPTHELLGESLLELNRPSEAHAALQAALARAPGRRLSTALLARADKAMTNASAKAGVGTQNASGVEVHNH